MDDFKAKTIYQQGMDSFYENEGKYNNPFDISSEEFDLFERGWTQALKRHRGPMPDEKPGYSARSRPRVGGSLAEKYRNMRDWSRPGDD